MDRVLKIKFVQSSASGLNWFVDMLVKDAQGECWKNVSVFATEAEAKAFVSAYGDASDQCVEAEEIAEFFRVQGRHLNADFMRRIVGTLANAKEFFGWFNRHYPEPSNHPDHPWCRLGLSLYGVSQQPCKLSDADLADCGLLSEIGEVQS